MVKTRRAKALEQIETNEIKNDDGNNLNQEVNSPNTKEEPQQVSSSSSSSSSSSASSVSSSSPFIGASIQQPFSCAPLWTSGTSAELMTTNASADTSTSSVTGRFVLEPPMQQYILTEDDAAIQNMAHQIEGLRVSI